MSYCELFGDEDKWLTAYEIVGSAGDWRIRRDRKRRSRSLSPQLPLRCGKDTASKLLRPSPSRAPAPRTRDSSAPLGTATLSGGCQGIEAINSEEMK